MIVLTLAFLALYTLFDARQGGNQLTLFGFEFKILSLLIVLGTLAWLIISYKHAALGTTAQKKLV